MGQKISNKELQTFIGKQKLPSPLGWGSLLHCLFGKQFCQNLTEEQRSEVCSLLRSTIRGTVFSTAAFSRTTKSFDRILNAPYIKELQEAIKETNTLIGHFVEVSGHHKLAVTDLESLTIKTVLSDKSPHEMVTDLKGAFHKLVHLMEEDVKALKKMGKTDQLTGLANRRGFDEYLRNQWKSIADSSCHLLMLDIDYFKLFNDEFGHLVGDEVLGLVASVIAKSTKDKDVCPDHGVLAARYGGEEFAIVLPSCSEKESLALAEFIRARVENYPLVIRNTKGEILKKNVHLTVSIGVASMHPQWLTEPEACVHNLLQAADQAMYEAKKRGRNMVCQHKAYKGADGRLTSVIM